MKAFLPVYFTCIVFAIVVGLGFETARVSAQQTTEQRVAEAARIQEQHRKDEESRRDDGTDTAAGFVLGYIMRGMWRR